MQTRVRFAPSPTGTLTVGNALGAVANRRFGDWMLLRIDDTDPARNVPGGEEGIVRDLEWLGVAWDEGPLRTSERAERHREAAAGLPQLFDGVMLLARRRLADLPPGERRRRHRLRDHARRARQRPPAERAAAPAPARGARQPAAGVRPPRAPPRRRRKEAVEAGRGGDGRVVARGRDPGRGRARLPRGARPATARCAATTWGGSGACRSTRSRLFPTRSSRRASARRSSSSLRCAARAIWTRRGRRCA